MKYLCAALLAGCMVVSAAEQTSVTVDGKNITVKYDPAVKGKVVASFHTDADLVFKGLAVPKGDYSVVLLVAADKWQLVFNKQKAEVGRVAVNLAKAPAKIDNCKLTLSKTAALAAKLEIAFEGNVGTVPFHLDRVAGDSEW
jgi:hypothetical protein